MSSDSRVRRVVFVLWGGRLGGAERHTVEIARIMRSELEVEASVVFIEKAERSAEALDALGIPWVELALPRGSSAITHPQLVGDAITASEPDAVYLGYGGYLARAVRMGGYDGVLLSVEHGGILQVPSWTLAKKVKEVISRAIGERTLDATICVSGLIRSIVLSRVHADAVQVIYNGVDLERYRPVDDPRSSVVFGHAGRLIEGKGVLNLVRAFDEELARLGCRLIIAGDGPARAAAEAIVAERGMADNVEFTGVIDDMPAFWRRCSVVVHPTTLGWKESFCLAVVEGQATGLPAIVSSAGALPEIVLDDRTGTVIPPDDIPGLHAAMKRYATDEELRRRHGAAARERAVECFEIHRAAREYVAFAEKIRAQRSGVTA